MGGTYFAVLSSLMEDDKIKSEEKMMRSVNSEVRSSKYQQVAVAVAKRIADGDYEVGEKLKSRSTLASTFNVSPETARKGLNILADMHIVSLKHGSGAIVLSKEKAEDFLKNYESTHSIAMIKNKIRENIKKQVDELESLTDLVDEYLLQSQSVSRKYPFTPYEIILTESASHLGESIRDLNIWHQTGATIVGIEHEGILLLSPSPYAVLEPGDHIFFVGDDLAYSRLKNLFNLNVGL